MQAHDRKQFVFFSLLLCLLTTAGLMLSSPARADFSVLQNFNISNGSKPYGNLIADSFGNLYGITLEGGDFGFGTIFMLDEDGTLYTLYSFTGGSDGANPTCTLTVDSSGNLYGTTSGGGASNLGTVFRLSDSNILTTLKSFTGGADGANPYGGVIRDSSGNLYGTTYFGGSSSLGVIYQITSAGVFSVLSTFNGTNGAKPYFGSLVRDSSGNLYGTTNEGGTSNRGTVFKYTASTATLTTLKSFTGGADGGNPNAGVLRDSSGNLFGTTAYGGTSASGVLFRVSNSGVYTKLKDFTGTDGVNPICTLLRDGNGNLYGTTYYGGTTNSGVAFRFDPTSGQYLILRNFKTSTDGGNPIGGFYRASNGTITGLTSLGGSSGTGTVYKITYPYLVNLADFNSSTGILPHAGLIRDSNGNYYGVTSTGGLNGGGTIYRFKPGTGITVLRHLSASDGTNPQGQLVRDSSGTLYGTCVGGGASGFGTVWKLSSAGVFTKLRDFSGADGKSPFAGLFRDSTTGLLYGTTSLGGASNLGTVFSISTSGAFLSLFQFNEANGRFPDAGVIRDSAGNIYGTTSRGGASFLGTVFRLTSSKAFTTLRFFTGGADGRFPKSALIRDSAGNLYGTTSSGGSSDSGVLFTFDGNGKFFVRHSFTGGDGNFPFGLIRDSGGNLYGVTTTGGVVAEGVVYRLSPSNGMTTLAQFGLGQAGINPSDILFRDSAGNLFGVTETGGANNGGTIFGLFN